MSKKKKAFSCIAETFVNFNNSWAENCCLKFTSNRIRRDRNHVLNAVKSNPGNIFYADLKLLEDKEIVMHAVFEFPMILKFVSSKLRDDDDVISVSNGVKEVQDFYPGHDKNLTKKRTIFVRPNQYKSFKKEEKTEGKSDKEIENELMEDID
jgi:hypothetical protein